MARRCQTQYMSNRFTDTLAQTGNRSSLAAIGVLRAVDQYNVFERPVYVNANSTVPGSLSSSMTVDTGLTIARWPECCCADIP